MLPKIEFKVRQGDIAEDGGVRELGDWFDKNTDDYFKGKRVVVCSVYLVHLHRLAHITTVTWL